ncbi:hypothetical protein DL98DRAFT_599733 [Cadophora sp. DSE1049]|nr:hypothetical protein DL98DRAFT_599733 [Cadophora sp. DSE1049]
MPGFISILLDHRYLLLFVLLEVFSFIHEDNLCTRFATEVILRRASDSEIRVSLVPGKGRSSVDQDRLWQFRYEVSSLEDFIILFEQAKDAMGLLSIGGNAFTEDILRVEILGPTQPQLTIFDLPGLIHSHNKHQTEHDVELVTNLVAKYMANPRSIILAIPLGCLHSHKNLSSLQLFSMASTVPDRGTKIDIDLVPTIETSQQIHTPERSLPSHEVTPSSKKRRASPLETSGGIRWVPLLMRRQQAGRSFLRVSSTQDRRQVMINCARQSHIGG